MKKKWSGILFIIFNMAAMSQQKEGKIVFERTMQMQIRISDNEQAEQSMPAQEPINLNYCLGITNPYGMHLMKKRHQKKMPGLVYK